MRFKNCREQKRQEVSDLISSVITSHNEFYIFTANKQGRITQNYLNSLGKNILGYIDPSIKSTHFYGCPVFISTSDLNPDVPVFNAAAFRINSSNKMLRTLGFNCIIDYLDCNLYDEKEFPIPFIVNDREDIVKNFSKYIWLHNLLIDDWSKKTLECVVDARYNNILDKDVFKFKIAVQYFDVIKNFTPIEIFADCGAYHGETSLEFIKRNPDYKSIYIFEPFQEAMKECKKQLENYTNINFIQKATFNKSTIVKFSTDDEHGNSISAEGDTVINTCKLDDEIHSNIDYIKYDVEGFELESLEGTKNIIEKYNPLLAVAVYHKQSHFWEVPELVLKMNPNYTVLLRHYSDHPYETDMYFVPERLLKFINY